MTSNTDFADSIYYGGKIYTMESNRNAEVVATKGDKIIFVGSKNEAMKYTGKNTKIIDLKTKIMFPGFVEPHIHHALTAAFFQITTIRADEDWGLPNMKLKPVMEHNQYIKEMKKAEKKLKDPNEWFIIAGYAKYYHGEITKDELEKVSSTRPIILFDRSGHVATLNNKALQAFGYTTENTKDNPDIDFAKGRFVEHATIEKIFPQAVILALKGNRWRNGLADDVKFMHEKGITTTGDMLGYDGFLSGQNEIFKQIIDAPDVPFRTYMFTEPRYAYEKGGEQAMIEYANQVTNKTGTNLIYPKASKFFVDGAFFSQLMLFKDGYTDGHQGVWITPAEELKAIIPIAWKQGHEIHIHVQADLGLDFLLEIFANLKKNYPMPNNRVTFHHVGYARKDQAKKIKDLGIMVSFLPYYHRALADVYSKYGLGKERAERISPAGSFVKEGVTISLHSDFCMAPANPLFSAWCAVNRVGVLSGKVLAPEERLTVDQAMKAITIDAAKTINVENITGSITVGKKADFVLLAKDPYKIDPKKLKDIKVIATIFNGRYFSVK